MAKRQYTPPKLPRKGAPAEAFDDSDEHEGVSPRELPATVACLTPQRRVWLGVGHARRHAAWSEFADMWTASQGFGADAALRELAPVPAVVTPRFNDAERLPCGHAFHGQCLRSCVKQAQCPLCAAPYRPTWAAGGGDDFDELLPPQRLQDWTAGHALVAALLALGVAVLLLLLAVACVQLARAVVFAAAVAAAACEASDNPAACHALVRSFDAIYG
jgi:hypothetical protein